MASNDNTRSLASPSQLKAEILQRLQEDGLDVTCSDDEKLLFLWRLYKESEASLQTALENEEKLRIGQTEEMQEVGNYVEHIRHLSDEREALIQELETENEQLKNETKFLKESQNETGREEISEMLVQQGLEELSEASTSEQIAYLLVERARLLDELEVEQNQSQSDGRASAELATINEQQKQDFEEELRVLRENTKSAQESASRTHEEEITSLMSENMRMLDETEEMTIRAELMEAEIKSLKEELSKEKDLREKEFKGKESAEAQRTQPVRPPSPARTNSDMQLRKVIEEKTKIEGEIVHFRSKFRDAEDENVKLKQEIQKLETDLDKAQMIQQQLQMKNKNLRSELEETETQLDETEAAVEELTTEKEELSVQLSEVKKQLVASSNTQVAPQTATSNETRLQEELEMLRKELEEKDAEKDRLSITNLQFAKSEKELRSQCESQQDDIQYISSENEQLISEIAEFKKTVSSLKGENKALSEEKENIDRKNETLSEENKHLQEQLLSVQKDADDSKSSGQNLAKQEIIVSHLREQNQKLTSQLNEVKNKLQEECDKTEKLDHHKMEYDKLKESQQKISAENGKLKDSVEQYEKIIHEHVSTIKDYENQLNVLKLDNDSLKQNEVAITSQLEKVGSQEEELSRLKTLVTNSEKELSNLKTELKNSKEKVQNSHIVNRELDELKETTDALQNELEDLREVNSRQKEEYKKHILEKDEEIFDLQEQIDNADEHKDEYDKMKTDLEVTKKKLAESLERETSLKDLRDNLDPRYQTEIEDLKAKLQMTLEELARSQTMISEEKGAKLEIEANLLTLQQTLQQKESNNTLVEESINKTISVDTHSQPDNSSSHDKDLEISLRQERERNEELEGKLKEYEGMSGQLIMAKDKLERVNQEKMNLQNNFFDAEKALQDQRILCENIEISLKAKADKLQRELEDVSFKLNTAEHKLYEAEDFRTSVADKNEEILLLKDHLENEKTQRALLEQTVQEMKQQVTLLKQQENKLNKNNREQQHKIMSLESKVLLSPGRSQTEFNMQHSLSEAGKLPMLDQISKLQAEMKDLQYELLSANEKKDQYYRHYQDRKFRTKEKLMRAREYYTREQTKLSEQIQKMEDNLQKTKAVLNKEIVWKEKIADSCKDLTKEKRDLMSKLSEQDENLKDKCRTISVLQVRSRYLEEENVRLQNQTASASQQKFNFNKMVKESMRECLTGTMNMENGFDAFVIPMTGDMNKEKVKLLGLNARSIPDFYYQTSEMTGDRQTANLAMPLPTRGESQTKMDGNQYSLTNVSSGIGNSVNSSWDHDHLTDEFTFHTTDTPFTSLLNRAQSGAMSINLYEDGSDGQEFDA